jgi:hypothetical protein
MFSLKILNGPLSGFDMMLNSGLWHLYIYNQNNEPEQIRVANNVKVASDNVIFIPVYGDENTRHMQLQLGESVQECRYGWQDEPASFQTLTPQQKTDFGGLSFALKTQHEHWEILHDSIALPVIQPTEPSDVPLIRPHKVFSWRLVILLCGLLILAVTTVYHYFTDSSAEDAPQIATSFRLTPQVRGQMEKRLSEAGILWLSLSQNEQHKLVLRLLTDGQQDGVKRATQLFQQNFPAAGTVVIYSHTLQEMQRELQLLFAQTGIQYYQETTAEGIYVAVRQALTPEALDFLNQRLMGFYQRWGQQRVHVSIQLPDTSTAPRAVLQRGQDDLIWDRKNHIFRPVMKQTL